MCVTTALETGGSELGTIMVGAAAGDAFGTKIVAALAAADMGDPDDIGELVDIPGAVRAMVVAGEEGADAPSEAAASIGGARLGVRTA